LAISAVTLTGQLLADLGPIVDGLIRPKAEVALASARKRSPDLAARRSGAGDNVHRDPPHRGAELA
jgi:hypothetical protein